MTAHELARRLLAAPDLPVCVIGQGGMEGFTIDLSEIKELDAVRRKKRHTNPPCDYYVTIEEYDEETLSDLQKDGGERGQIIQLS